VSPDFNGYLTHHATPRLYFLSIIAAVFRRAESVGVRGPVEFGAIEEQAAILR